MSENTKQKGRFWLPEHPEHKIDGEFELIDNSKGQLTLYGYIDPIIDQNLYFKDAEETMQHPIIVGELINGSYLALLESSFNHIGNFYMYRYDIRYTIYTNRLKVKNENDLKFKYISFSFDNLDSYLGECDIEEEIGSDFCSISLKYSHKEDTFRLSKSIQCRFIYGFGYSSNSFPVETKIIPQTIIELESDSDISIQEWLRIADEYFGNFFSIIIGKHLCPQRLLFKSESGGKAPRYKAFYRYFKKQTKALRNKGHVLKNMMPELKGYIRSFMTFAEKYPIVISNYMTLFKFEAILEYEYLSAVYSLETFSRYVRENHNFFEPDEFENQYSKPLLGFIKENLSREENQAYIERLNNSVIHSNERSFRAILRQICTENKDIISKILEINKTDINQIVDSRNWYTHFSKDLEGSIAKGKDLYVLFIKVRVLFEILLFKEMKMPDAVIIETIKETYL